LEIQSIFGLLVDDHRKSTIFNAKGRRQNMSSGKRAVVTGGGNGIGQAFSKRLAAQGASIVVADIADASATVGAIKKGGGSAIAVRCDQTSEADVAKLQQAVEKELGGCDILVHCAGIYPTAAFEEITFEQWRKVLSVNLDSVFLLVKAFLPAMKQQRWGRIVSVSSTTFHSGIGFNTHYTASKGGLIGFARSLASEVGDFGITVNTIAPGLTRTETTINGKPGEFGWFDMIREQQAIKRTETPEDLTGTLAFLASEDAAFITGQTIVVDGGWRFS
jgi:(S)-1-phenylethanol dehydrogenase